MKRINLSSGAPWEDIIGYSRAVRIGQQIEVTGTVSIKDGVVFGEGDPYLQTKQILDIIEDQITQLGATLDDVIRTRIYVTDINYWEEVGRAHAEKFNENKPATSLIEVSKLISPEYLVEIEASAICSLTL
jgi:enamine deaminase RidA (YjgF/YER057c/UK114 family)